MATRLTMRGVNPGDAVCWMPSLQTSYHGIYTQEQDLVRGVRLPEWTRLEITGTFYIMSEVQRGRVLRATGGWCGPNLMISKEE